MKTIRISEAEWEVMNVLWGRGPMTCPDLVAQVAETRDWHIRTVRTLLDRLVSKGAVHMQTPKRPYRYEAAVNRADCVQSASRSFAERVFGGNPAPMLVHLVKQTDLTRAEIRELRRILREKED